MKEALIIILMVVVALVLPTITAFYVHTLFEELNIMDLFMLWLGCVVMFSVITIGILDAVSPTLVRGEFSNRNHRGV
ncbi:hypothetical protein OBP_200 [Pseudomonas phage OBP]|uniref:hypothetical protein n=1 Tax=Pseudomonas phage OBP TaxID=1124849 RepID=UPI000240D5A8|nr:hypothetical protein OBP_200 [Pseudomonas phage OBP]AEV89637.1 hypothetical protein OBP_200 [Pseudomonas phage OBP]